MGASLLVFLNKTDVEGCMDENEVRQVCFYVPNQTFPSVSVGFGGFLAGTLILMTL